MNRATTAIVLLLLGQGPAACSGSPTSPGEFSTDAPSTPPPVSPPPAPLQTERLIMFSDGSGFSTPDAHDSDDQVVQVASSGHLIWTSDGTRLPGYRVFTHLDQGRPWSFIEGNLCAEGCSLEVRFGMKNGEKRAYLTADYGHDNPGTMVDLEFVNGALRVSRTNLFPPGTFTQSGLVTEATAAGPIPLEGVRVERAMTGGYQSAVTDKRGFYTIFGMFNGTSSVYVSKDGYKTHTARVTIDGDTRFDTQLVRH